MKETTITFDEFLNREFGTIGTTKRKRADARLNKIAKEQENKIRKILNKQP